MDPEAGATFRRAIDAASQVLYEEEKERPVSSATVLAAQRRADATGRVAEAALVGGLDQGARGDRYQVVVHVDAGVLAEEGEAPVPENKVPENPKVLEAPARAGIPGLSEIEGIGRIPAGTSRRIACDASKVVMTHDPEGRLLDLGRKTRVISPALRRALTYRDGGCRFPGCGLAFCDAHHVEHWADGGETKLDNLVLLCRAHHRCVHEEGYRVERTAGGELRFSRPDGGEILEAPPPQAALDLPGIDDALLGIEGWLTEAGADADWRPRYPEWDGSRLDLDWALDALWSSRGGTDLSEPG